jgi:hypothetical protein
MKTKVAYVKPIENDPIMFRVSLECGHGMDMCERDVDLTKIRAGRTVECYACDSAKALADTSRNAGIEVC